MNFVAQVQNMVRGKKGNGKNGNYKIYSYKIFQLKQLLNLKFKNVGAIPVIVVMKGNLHEIYS